MNNVLYFILSFFAGLIMSHIGVGMDRWENWAMLAILIAIRIISSRECPSCSATNGEVGRED